MMQTMQLEDSDYNLASLKNEAYMQINFLRKLTNMAHRVQKFNEYFGARIPSYERIYKDRKYRIVDQQLNSKYGSLTLKPKL